MVSATILVADAGEEKAVDNASSLLKTDSITSDGHDSVKEKSSIPLFAVPQDVVAKSAQSVLSGSGSDMKTDSSYDS